MLNSLRGSASTLIGSCRYLVYCRLMKFSVASKSRRVMVLALFDFECIKTRSVIDFLVERNTSWSWYHLSSANLIRHWENPVLPLHTSRSACLSDHLGGSQMW